VTMRVQTSPVRSARIQTSPDRMRREEHKLTGMKTADLCDAHADLRVLTTALRDYGAVREASGEIVTLQVLEDNALVRATLERAGEGRVLVVDGGGSLRTALLGGNLGALAEQNGWAGVVIHGAVRDVTELARCRVAIKALAATPRRSAKAGAGERDVPLSLDGVPVAPGDWLYADEDGVVIADRRLAG
jgi:regulator of ribonuclease activity A